MTEENQNPPFDRIPAHPPTPQGIASQGPQRFILMTPHMIMIGSLIAFITGALAVVLLPQLTFHPQPSANWVPISDQAHDGRAQYLANGCFYCHSYYTRPQDTFVGQYYVYTRTSEPGDYRTQRESPNIFGTERTGPDLFNEGGMHPDDWHDAHYADPRNVNPLSIMPSFSFMSDPQRIQLIEFGQESGGKEGILRAATMRAGKRMMLGAMGMKGTSEVLPDQAKAAGAQYNANGKPSDKSPSGLAWKEVWDLNSRERGYWLTPDPLPVTQENLMRGKAIFLQRCSGCHGAKGDGKGPAAKYLMPTPADFTGYDGAHHDAPSSDGNWYHRILTAGKGSAMENFGTRLSVEDTWRVVLFLRTISSGTLKDQRYVPMPSDWQPWTPKPEAVNYYNTHPISQGPGPIDNASTDPFAAAAHWLTPGLAPSDTVMLGGQVPMTQADVANLIRTEYFAMINKAYDDAQSAGERELPPRSEIQDTRNVTFHAPS